MLPTPFTNMAVSLSGGGYRATAFHLGALSYLYSKTFLGKTLLQHVSILSTISGGTITGVMYALFLAEGRNFDACYERLYSLLENDKLVELALQKLNNPSSWKNNSKSRDLINAFAEVYNEHFFEEATFSKLLEAQESHLSDAIFGASEFTYGIQFRLQEERGKGKFGNFFLNLPESAAKKIRLADAVAASSCFPGGFEPMIMPTDFGNGPESKVDTAWKEKGYQTTAIMDGGIIDNQGIEGVKLAEIRHSKPDEPFVGTYIVSDVSGDMMAPYEVPEFKSSKIKNFISLKVINIFACLVIIVLLIVLLFFKPPLWVIVLSSSLSSFAVAWFLFFLYVRSAIRGQIRQIFSKDQVPDLLRDLKVLLRTPVYILLYLVKFRATSSLKMVMDVFLRRIRRLQLNNLYESEDWKYRFKSNYIYALEKEETLPANIKKVIHAANNMPTTLWFSRKEKKEGALDDLIACGQFTLCQNLIKYISRLKERESMKMVWDSITENERQAILKLEEEMQKDWQKFLADPYWLMKQMKP